MADLNFGQILEAVIKLTEGVSTDYSPNNPMANFVFPERGNAFEVVERGARAAFGVTISQGDFNQVESVGQLATMIAMQLNPDKALPQIVAAVLKVHAKHPNRLTLETQLTDDTMKKSPMFGTTGKVGAVVSCEQYFGVEITNQSIEAINTGGDIVRFVYEGLLAKTAR